MAAEKYFEKKTVNDLTYTDIYKDNCQYRVFDENTKTIYQVIGVGPLVVNVVANPFSEPDRNESRTLYQRFIAREIKNVREKAPGLTNTSYMQMAVQGWNDFKKNDYNIITSRAKFHVLFNPQPWHFSMDTYIESKDININSIPGIEVKELKATQRRGAKVTKKIKYSIHENVNVRHHAMVKIFKLIQFTADNFYPTESESSSSSEDSVESDVINTGYARFSSEME